VESSVHASDDVAATVRAKMAMLEVPLIVFMNYLVSNQ
jgi:hypothetical protein